MTKNTFIIIIGALVILVFIVSLAMLDRGAQNDSGANVSSGGSEYSAGALEVLENNFDFGTVSMKDGNVSHRFELKNNGQESVKVGKVYTSCMCTTAYLMPQSSRRGPFGMPGHTSLTQANMSIESGDSLIVEAVFDPAAHGISGVGLNQRTIYLETNSAANPKVALNFQAVVVR